MRRDELITKLARELPHWPAGLNKDQLARLIAPVFMPPYSGLYYGCADNFGETEAYLHIWDITRADYLAECDRLGVTAPEPMPGPVKSVWNGEGLPPVGTICEAQLDSGQWAEAEILAHYRPCQYGREVAVFAFSPSKESPNRIVTQLIAGQFRPLLSEEDRAVEEMLKDIGIVTGKAERVRKAVCRRLYRARYRKTGGDA